MILLSCHKHFIANVIKDNAIDGVIQTRARIQSSRFYNGTFVW